MFNILNNFIVKKNNIDINTGGVDKSIEKGIVDFSNIIAKYPTGDRFVSSSNSIQTIKRSYSSSKFSRQKFGLVVVGTKCYFSLNFLESAKSYILNGLPVCFVLDRTIKNNPQVYKKLSSYEKLSNVSIHYFSRSVSLSDRILIGIDTLASEYISIFTLLDYLNTRSYLVFISKILENKLEKSFFFSNSVIDLKKEVRSNAAISSLSGVIFNSDFLKSILIDLHCESSDNWLGYYVLSNFKDSEFQMDSSVFNTYWYTHEPVEISVPDLAFFIKDSICLIELGLSNEKLHENVIMVLSYAKQILFERKMTNTKISMIASGCSLILLKIKNFLTLEEYRKYVYLFSTLFDFDQLLKSDVIHSVHKMIIEKVINVRKECIAVIETDFMNDLRKSLVKSLINAGYDVIYVSKPQYYDYHFLNCLVIRAEIQPAQFVIASNDIHKFITNGKSVLTLWHGLGMLKKIAEVDRIKYPMDYIVTSSASCVIPWADTFKLSPNNVLPFGQVQTDVLYNDSYVLDVRNKIRKFYTINSRSKVVFFAPTFRNGTIKYYNFGMDIEKLSIELEKNDIYIITKKHHVFSHILKDKGIDTSGVLNSNNGHFIVDEDHDFIDLICCADCFITDYSSGLFYALVRNIPIMLYAPDVKEYKEGLNGFMISYPEDLPFPFVGTPSISLFIEKLNNVWGTNQNDAYKQFKNIHVGSCDGNVSKRIIDFIKSWNGKSFDLAVANDILLRYGSLDMAIGSPLR